MKRILRRIVNLDLLGRLLSETVEQVTDDEEGTIEELHAAAYCTCQACGRPLEKIEDMRGTCVECGQACCSQCVGHCAICRSPLCSHCREGFPERGLSVCGHCREGLEKRLARQDRFQEDEIAFKRQMEVYNAQMKLIQLGLHDKGSLSELIARVAQFRLTRKLHRIEKQLSEGKNHGHKLLPWRTED